MRGNKCETLRDYIESDAIEKRPYKGVASWSKILVLSDPTRFAILDARVCEALNALQIYDDWAATLLFPTLPNRNTAIAEFQSWRKKHDRRGECRRMAPDDVYQTYLTVLKLVDRRSPQYCFSAIEMTLFAHAERLVRRTLDAAGVPLAGRTPRKSKRAKHVAA